MGPDPKLDLFFDGEGVCSACRSFESRSEVDWVARRSEFKKLIARYRSMDGGNYDCTVPVSGGKDSTYQVIRLLEFAYSVLVDRDTGATEEIEEPLYEILKRRAFNRDEWRALKEHSDSLGLAFFATAGFPEEIEFLIGLGCHSIKIASADVNHKTLIRQAAATGVCLQIGHR